MLNYSNNTINIYLFTYKEMNHQYLKYLNLLHLLIRLNQEKYFKFINNFNLHKKS